MESYYRVILWNYMMESYYGIILMKMIPGTLGDPGDPWDLQDPWAPPWDCPGTPLGPPRDPLGPPWTTETAISKSS